MSANYIPAKQSQRLTWALNFSSLITASPTTYGLVTSDAVSIAAVVTAFNTAYTAATSPATKTPDTVQAKNVANVNMLAVVRPYSQTVANNAAVSSANKIALGLNPRTSTPTPVPAPTTFPNLTIQSAGVLTHVIRYRDSAAAPSVKSKPAGAVALQLYCTVSATPITDQDLLDFMGPETKSPFQTTFQSADAGKLAYYAARWATRRGLVGPWSAISSFTVASS